MPTSKLYSERMKTREVIVIQYYCCRCNSWFTTRRSPPTRCGKCTSPYWNRPRKTASTTTPDRQQDGGGSTPFNHQADANTSGRLDIH